MMIVPSWLKRCGRPGLAIALGLLLVLAAAGLAAASFEPMRHLRQSPTRLDEAAARVWRNSQLKSRLEIAVIVLQVAGVVAFCLSRLLPETRWADRGRVVFVASLLGLGGAGTLCAAFGSEFALFAGGAMAVLLNAVILGPSQGHAARHRAHASGEPFMAV